MKVRASASAERDLLEIRRYIAADNPSAADRVIVRIRQASQRLADQPEMGTIGSRPRTREWVVRGLPYIIVYRVDWADEEIVLLNIFHGARHRPS